MYDLPLERAKRALEAAARKIEDTKLQFEEKAAHLQQAVLEQTAKSQRSAASLACSLASAVPEPVVAVAPFAKLPSPAGRTGAAPTAAAPVSEPAESSGQPRQEVPAFRSHPVRSGSTDAVPSVAEVRFPARQLLTGAALPVLRRQAPGSCARAHLLSVPPTANPFSSRLGTFMQMFSPHWAPCVIPGTFFVVPSCPTR